MPLLPLIAAILASNVSHGASCPIIGARYAAMRGAASIAGFDRISPVSDTINDLTLFVRPAGKRVQHFYLGAGSSSIISLYPVPSDPRRQGWYQPSDTSPRDGRYGPQGRGMRYTAADAAGRSIGDIPQSEDAAPAYVTLQRRQASERPLVGSVERLASTTFVRTRCGPRTDLPTGPATRLNDAETRAVVALDLTSFVPAMRQDPLRRTLSERGFVDVVKANGVVRISNAGRRRMFGVRVLDDTFRAMTLCVLDHSASDATPWKTMAVVRGDDRLYHATGAAISDPRCPA